MSRNTYHRDRPPFAELLIVQGPDSEQPPPTPWLRSQRWPGVTLYSAQPAPTPGSHLFLGVARLGSRLLSGPAELAPGQISALRPLGPYLTCHVGRSSDPHPALHLKADPFGLYQIFHGRFGDSHRLHLLVEAAHRAGHQISVNHAELSSE